MRERRSTALVRDAMTPNVECAHLYEPLQTAAERMRARDIRALPVLDGDRIVGMITTNDIVQRAVSLGHDPRRTLVHEILTNRVVTCRDDHTLNEAAVIMEGAHVRHLPVLDQEGRLVGMLSLEDLTRSSLEPEILERVIENTVPDRQEDEQVHAPKAYLTKPKLSG
ncbi:MAG: CBS domain-containing protein [Alphaproteobacteria bacterium]